MVEVCLKSAFDPLPPLKNCSFTTSEETVVVSANQKLLTVSEIEVHPRRV